MLRTSAPLIGALGVIRKAAPDPTVDYVRTFDLSVVLEYSGTTRDLK